MRSKTPFSLFDVLLLPLNAVAVLLLTAAYLANVVSPEQNVLFAFAGLAYPYLLLVNVLFTVYWAARRRRLFLLPLLAILLGFPSLMRYYQYGGNLEEAPAGVPTLKVMSYNVQLLGRYHDPAADGQAAGVQDRDTMLRLIAGAQPDILCLQEYSHQNRTFPTVTLLHEALPQIHYRFPELSASWDHYTGNCILSAYPIVHAANIGHSSVLDNRSALYADIVVGTDTVRVYNLHLQSVQLQKEDYDFAQRLTTVQESETEGEGDFGRNSRRMLKKLRDAYRIRGVQVDSVIRHIESSPYPVIVCGDFNDTPWSYTYNAFRKRLKDSQVHSGRGRGHTFEMNAVLGFRIDYIFYSKGLENYGHTVIRRKASDHYPIYTYFAL